MLLVLILVIMALLLQELDSQHETLCSDFIRFLLATENEQFSPLLLGRKNQFVFKYKKLARMVLCIAILDSISPSAALLSRQGNNSGNSYEGTWLLAMTDWCLFTTVAWYTAHVIRKSTLVQRYSLWPILTASNKAIFVSITIITQHTLEWE